MCVYVLPEHGLRDQVHIRDDEVGGGGGMEEGVYSKHIRSKNSQEEEDADGMQRSEGGGVIRGRRGGFI